MIRISFRQSMLAGFLLIAFLLSWAALRSWLVLEQFVEQSRQGSEQALQLSASIQELAERTVDIERSTRQFMLLNNAALLERFDENVSHSLDAVWRLEAVPGQPLGKLPAAWRQAVEELSQNLHQEAPRSGLMQFLNRLARVNSELDRTGRRWIHEQQVAILADLEESREHLTRLVGVAVVSAFVVAVAMGWWLAQPIVSLERSIERLGEGHFDHPVTVGGPDDLRRVGRRLDWLRRRLGELETERERTLRHVSHELKTPLTALREGIALLQEQVVGSLEGSQQEVVDILQDNVMALQRHIESLLRLNAAAFEARRLCYRPVPLRKLLAEVVQGRELQIQARQLRVVTDAPSITRKLDGDKLLVALDNLLSNAIEFSPEGGLIRLQAEVVDNILRITCIDRGPGIAAEDAERIFEPFVQGGRASPTPRQGSGVGLSIVRELMTAMGGRVLLVPGKWNVPGASFRIEIPCES
jgi:two-component system sensor histidine kinase GlrK